MQIKGAKNAKKDADKKANNANEKCMQIKQKLSKFALFYALHWQFFKICYEILSEKIRGKNFCSLFGFSRTSFIFLQFQAIMAKFH